MESTYKTARNQVLKQTKPAEDHPKVRKAIGKCNLLLQIVVEYMRLTISRCWKQVSHEF